MIDWRSEFVDSGLDAVFRVDDPELWTDVYNRLAFRPVNYLASMLDYQLAYRRGSGAELQELSCVLRSDNKAVAIWPLTIGVCDGVASVSSEVHPVSPPVFVPHCAASTNKRLTATCQLFVNRLADRLDLSEWHSTSSFVNRADIGNWQIGAMGQGARCSVRHELYVDLRLTLQEIKSRFRKSFRSLVTSGERTWHVEVLCAPGDPLVWDEFRQLHVEVSGRVTRSMESWQIQHAALAADDGFLVVLRDANGRMVGGGYFTCSADEGLYAVAAYDRRLFNQPLGHVVQFRAIQELQRRGCRWYRIGTRSFPGEEPAPTAKELAIASFKHGFASHVFPKFCLMHPVPAKST